MIISSRFSGGEELHSEEDHVVEKYYIGIIDNESKVVYSTEMKKQELAVICLPELLEERGLVIANASSLKEHMESLQRFPLSELGSKHIELKDTIRRSVDILYSFGKRPEDFSACEINLARRRAKEDGLRFLKNSMYRSLAKKPDESML